MPSFCSVVGCSMRAERDQVSFFRIPAVINHKGDRIEEITKFRRERWIRSLKRGKLSETFLKNARICSKHFVSGSPAKLEDLDDPDWIPTQNLGYEIDPLKHEKYVERFERLKERWKKAETIMIKVPNQIESNERIFISDTIGECIPININSRLTNELGKQLLKAASNGDASETQRLLYEGAPFTADWLGTSPLHLAAQGNHVEICEILLKAGISTNARTKVDRTPLHMAAFEGHLDVVQLLLKEEADPNETDLLGMTPLHWAVQNGHFEVVQALLNGGARKDLENRFNLKPSDIANQIGRYDIIHILEEERLENKSASENLAIEMAAEDENMERMNDNSINTIHMENLDECSNNLEDITQMKFDCDESDMENSLSDSMKILQEHGITLLPTDDDNNILSTVMESGHSVVLTEVGKQILDSVKAEEESSQNITRNLANLERERFMSVNPDDLLTFSTDAERTKKRKNSVDKESKNIKRIVMKKDKFQSISLAPNIQRNANANVQLVRLGLKESEVERLLKELTEAKRTIDEYKEKLKEKEEEVENYKMKLNLLGYS